MDSSPPRLDPAKETGVVTEKTIRATKFQLGQRVAFFDNKEGAKHYGVVRWTGTESRTKKFPYVVVGIETVSTVQCMHCQHIYICNPIYTG